VLNIVKTPTCNSFFNLEKNSKDEVLLCTPYIKQVVAEDCRNIAQQSKEALWHIN
jgi:hypothetical protein